MVREIIPCDLVETLGRNSMRHQGLTAGMIGENKRIMAISAGLMPMLLLNPQLIKGEEPFVNENGDTRYRHVTVTFNDVRMRGRTLMFTTGTAQTVQEMLDRPDGKEQAQKTLSDTL